MYLHWKRVITLKSLDNLDIRKTILNQVSEQLFSNTIATSHTNCLKGPSDHLEYPSNDSEHRSSHENTIVTAEKMP